MPLAEMASPPLLVIIPPLCALVTVKLLIRLLVITTGTVTDASEVEDFLQPFTISKTTNPHAAKKNLLDRGLSIKYIK